MKVEAEWKVCALAARPLPPNWDSLEQIIQLQNYLMTKGSFNSAKVSIPELKNSSRVGITSVV